MGSAEEAVLGRYRKDRAFEVEECQKTTRKVEKDQGQMTAFGGGGPVHADRGAAKRSKIPDKGSMGAEAGCRGPRGRGMELRHSLEGFTLQMRRDICLI